MIARRILLALAVLSIPLAAYVLYPSFVERDFDHICAVYTETAAKAAELDPATLAFERASMIEKGIWSSAAKKTMQAVSMANPSEKYGLIRQSAILSGYKEWNCPAMETQSN